MRFVATGADEKFNAIIDFWQQRVYACGLIPLVYNLGGLNKGTLLAANLPGFDNFRQHGYYLALGDGTYKSRAVHKPSVVMRAMREVRESVLYLDTDAFLRGVPTKMEGDWDVCVTVRPTSEQDRTSDEKRSYIGLLNAGVIWFNYNSASLLFAEEWNARTLEEMNDQRALNLMCQNVKVGEVTRVTLRDGTLVRVMGVPTIVYNNYYNEGVSKAAVVHLKNSEWLGQSADQLRKRCKVLADKPMPVKEKAGFFSRLFGGGKTPTHQHSGCCHHETVYVYDDSGVDLLDYYITYRVLENLFSSPPPVVPDVVDFVPPPVPDYSVLDTTPGVVQEDQLAVPAGVQAEITEFPAELENVADDTGNVDTPDDPVDDPTPASDNGS